MPGTEVIDQLRSELPRLLRERPEARYELWGMMLEAFPSRQEFMALLEEIRALREDSNRRFEATDRRFEELRADMNQRFEASDRRFEELRADMNQRFEASDRRFGELRADTQQRFEASERRFEESRVDMDQRFTDLRQDMDRRFEAVISELRTQRLHLSRLSGRLGYGLEYLVRSVVEEFAGKALTRSERLVLKDPQGEVFGVPADIEFDLFASDGEAYLCEVKSYIEREDVLNFHRKALFAAKHLSRPFVRVMIGASMEAAAEKQMKSLGIRYIVRARIEPDDSVTSL